MFSLLFRAELYLFPYCKLSSLCISLSSNDSKLRNKHVRHNAGLIPDGNASGFPQSVYKFIFGYYSNQPVSYSSSCFVFSQIGGLPYNQVLLKLVRSYVSILLPAAAAWQFSLTFHRGQLVLSPQNLFVFKHFKHTELNKNTFRKQFPHTNFLSCIVSHCLEDWMHCICGIQWPPLCYISENKFQDHKWPFKKYICRCDFRLSSQTSWNDLKAPWFISNYQINNLVSNKNDFCRL